MSLSEREKPANGVETTDIVASARRFIGALPDLSGKAVAVDEGREIAAIVETLGLSGELLAAALVYPLYRDEIVDTNTLENSQLQSISKIVIDLLQLGRFSLPADWQPGEALGGRQSEALRKMLLAVVSDVRLVLVRIAEQLCRLRHAKSATPEVQRALAIETREIYAALANRLGVWQLKWELEDLAFRYLDPETYKAIASALNEKRAEREQFIDDVKATLQAELQRQGIKAEVSGRPKHIFSIYRKMQRKDRGLESLYDIRAVRILVDDVKDCYAALGAVHNLWSYLPGEFDDYIAKWASGAEVQGLWSIDKTIVKRSGSTWLRAQTGTSGAEVKYISLPLIYQCKDGYLRFMPFVETGMLPSTMGLTEWVIEEGMASETLKKVDWRTWNWQTVSQETVDEITQSFSRFFIKYTKAELWEGAQKRGIQLYPLLTTSDMLEFEQLNLRDYWEEVHHPELSTRVTYPGAFVKLTDAPCKIRCRAPLIGEHNEEIYVKDFGYSKEEIQALKQKKVI